MSPTLDQDPFIALPCVVWLKDRGKFSQPSIKRIRISSLVHYEEYNLDAAQRSSIEQGRSFTKVSHVRAEALSMDEATSASETPRSVVRYYIVDCPPDKLDKFLLTTPLV